MEEKANTFIAVFEIVVKQFIFLCQEKKSGHT
jgi:hypothetical protein